MTISTVGIDISKLKFDLCLLCDNGKFKHNEVGRQKWTPCVMLTRQQTAARTVACTLPVTSTPAALAAAGDCRTGQCTR